MPTTRLTVAAFYASVSRPVPATLPRKLRENVHDYLGQTGLMFRSVLRLHPDARTVLLTDDVTDVDALGTVDALGAMEVVRAPMEPSRLIWHRLLAQIAFAETLADDELCLFLDGDMLVNRPLDPLFSLDADVMLTWQRKLPFLNGGFIGVRGGARARAFLASVRAVFEERFSERRGWGGDQDALCAALGELVVRPDATVIHRTREADVALLPCRSWNREPHDPRFAEILVRRRPYVLHFTGKRKRLMERYWRLYLAPTPTGERLELWRGTLVDAARDVWRPPPGTKAQVYRLRRWLLRRVQGDTLPLR